MPRANAQRGGHRPNQTASAYTKPTHRAPQVPYPIAQPRHTISPQSEAIDGLTPRELNAPAPSIDPNALAFASLCIGEPESRGDYDHVDHGVADAQDLRNGQMDHALEQAREWLIEFRHGPYIYTSNASSLPLRGVPFVPRQDYPITVKNIFRPTWLSEHRPHLAFVPLTSTFTDNLLSHVFWHEDMVAMLSVKKIVVQALAKGQVQYRCKNARDLYVKYYILDRAITNLLPVVYPPSMRSSLCLPKLDNATISPWYTDAYAAFDAGRYAYLVSIEAIGALTMLIALSRLQTGLRDAWRKALTLLDCYRSSSGAEELDLIASSIICHYKKPRVGGWIDVSTASPALRFHVRAIEVVRAPLFVKWEGMPLNTLITRLHENSALSRFVIPDERATNAPALADAVAMARQASVLAVPVPMTFPIQRPEKLASMPLLVYLEQRQELKRRAKESLSSQQLQTIYQRWVSVYQPDSPFGRYIDRTRAFAWYQDANGHWMSEEIPLPEVKKKLLEYPTCQRQYDAYVDAWELAPFYAVPDTLHSQLPHAAFRHAHWQDIYPQLAVGDEPVVLADLLHQSSSSIVTPEAQMEDQDRPPEVDMDMVQEAPPLGEQTLLEDEIPLVIPEPVAPTEMAMVQQMAMYGVETSLEAKIRPMAPKPVAPIGNEDVVMEDAEVVSVIAKDHANRTTTNHLEPSSVGWLYAHRQKPSHMATDALELLTSLLGFSYMEGYDHPEWHPAHDRVKLMSQVITMLGTPCKASNRGSGPLPHRWMLQADEMELGIGQARQIIDFVGHIVGLGEWVRAEEKAGTLDDNHLRAHMTQHKHLHGDVWFLQPSCADQVWNEKCFGRCDYDIEPALQLAHSTNPKDNWGTEPLWLLTIKDCEHRPKWRIGIYDPLIVIEALVAKREEDGKKMSTEEFLLWCVASGIRVCTPAPAEDQLVDDNKFAYATDFITRRRAERQDISPPTRPPGHVWTTESFKHHLGSLSQVFADVGLARAVTMAGGWYTQIGLPYTPHDHLLRGPTYECLCAPIGKVFVTASDERLYDDAFEFQQLYPIIGSYIMADDKRAETHWPTVSFFPPPTKLGNVCSLPKWSDYDDQEFSKAYHRYTGVGSRPFEPPLSKSAWGRMYNTGGDRARESFLEGARSAAALFLRTVLGPHPSA